MSTCTHVRMYTCVHVHMYTCSQTTDLLIDSGKCLVAVLQPGPHPNVDLGELGEHLVKLLETHQGVGVEALEAAVLQGELLEHSGQVMSGRELSCGGSREYLWADVMKGQGVLLGRGRA